MLNCFYLKRFLLGRLVLGILVFALGGCMGGTVAQQIARSIATSMADKAVAQAMDVDEDDRSDNNSGANSAQTQSASLSQNPLAEPPTPSAYAPGYMQNTQQPQTQLPSIETLAAKSPMPSQEELDEFNERYVLASSGFKTVEQIQAEQAETAPLRAPALASKAPEIIVESRPLVRVEILNLLAGDEKQAIYEKARLLGALNLPQAREWQRWRVATGRTENDRKLITFLVPPTFGKLPSGAKAMVELAGKGDLNIARYQEN